MLLSFSNGRDNVVLFVRAEWVCDPRNASVVASCFLVAKGTLSLYLGTCMFPLLKYRRSPSRKQKRPIPYRKGDRSHWESQWCCGKWMNLDQRSPAKVNQYLATTTVWVVLGY